MSNSQSDTKPSDDAPMNPWVAEQENIAPWSEAYQGEDRELSGYIANSQEATRREREFQTHGWVAMEMDFLDLRNGGQ